MPDVSNPTSPFGSLLRRWRNSRGLSQLELSAAAETTPRHLSFLETGRSRPSQSMVLRLCEALDVGLRERNELLVAAGLAPRYPGAELDADRYEPVRRAVEQLLEAHEPYPAVVLERHANVVASNRGAGRLFGADPTGTNMVKSFLSGPDPSEVIANWPAVARAMLARLRNDLARSPFDDDLRALVALCERTVARLGATPASSSELVVCPWFRIDGQIIRTMVLAARFDNAVDITLEELRVELVYPLDDEAEQFFRA